MTDPVDTDALRMTASDLRETGGWHPWRDDAQARKNWELIDAAADEVDRLRAVIEKAPHRIECNKGNVWRDGSTMPCTCWKADVL